MKRVLVGLVVMLSLTACEMAGVRSPSLSPHEALRQRAESYWSAKKAKDWKTVQTFVDPKVLPNLQDYFRKHDESKDLSTIVSFEIQKLVVEGDRGHTVTAVSFLLVHPLLGKPYPLHQTVEDHWVQRNGLWYVVITPPNTEDFLRRLQKKPERSKPGG
ncbi:MAG: hypothetical protein ACUVWY_10275 [Desulfosoma sp.]|uniref:hypothetical protein n=1 Tax=Desulfosoma sp. TaxID=2603217 RepID=UPI004048FBC7